MKKNARWIILFGMALIMAVGAGLVLFSAMPREPRHIRIRRLEEDNLRQVARALRFYADQNDGHLPVSLDTDILSAAEVNLTELPDELHLRYIGRTPSDQDEIIAYYWPPIAGGTAVLLGSTEVMWARTDRDTLTINTGSRRLTVPQ